MSSNVGHTIQKLLNNSPVAITANDEVSAVLTNGGQIHLAGLVGKRIQDEFKDVELNQDIVGNVVQAVASEKHIYVLSDNGSVFEFNYNSTSCPYTRQLYMPDTCGGDMAIKIAAGRDHVVILTANKKVYGAGANSQYQIVPQGQREYSNSTEIIIDNINRVTNCNSCPSTDCNTDTTFYGKLDVLNGDTTTSYPNPNPACVKPICITGSFPSNSNNTTIGNDVLDIYPIIFNDGDTHINAHIQLSVQLYGTYSGVLCTDCDGNAVGTINVNISQLGFVASGSYSTGVFNVNVGGTLPFNQTLQVPISQTINNGPICVSLTSDQINSLLSGLSVSNQNNTTIALSFGNISVILSAPNNTSIQLGDSENYITINNYDSLTVGCNQVSGACATACNCKPGPVKQPCWSNIFAGADLTVLLDNCNRLFVLGNLYDVRNNAWLAKNSCLEDLLAGAQTTVHFPADQLNCANGQVNSNCGTQQRSCKPGFQTDLSKFGLEVTFPPRVEIQVNEGSGSVSSVCSSNKYQSNVCDFLKKLKECNEFPQCENTCEPCDNTIYFETTSDCGIAEPYILNLYNKESICRRYSLGYGNNSSYRSDIINITVDSFLDLSVEFSTQGYCINGQMYPLCKIISISNTDVRDDTVAIPLYLNIEQSPRDIRWTACAKHGADVLFQPINTNIRIQPAPQPTNNVVQINYLNFGSPLDGNELHNLCNVLGARGTTNCPAYKRPIDAAYSTYVKGGDVISIIQNYPPCNSTSQVIPSGQLQMITADLPTVFDLRKRILDVAVGDKSLSVLVGSLNCPNDVLALGNNCYGQLGINNHVNALCWQKVNRCLLDSPIVKMAAHKKSTFYITQFGHVYASGHWGSVVKSERPVPVSCLNPALKIKSIAVSRFNIVLLTNDSCLLGLGDNQLGQLGLCHSNCVPCPTALSYFNKLARGLYRSWNSESSSKSTKCGKSCKCGGSDQCPDLCAKQPPSFKRASYSFAKNCEECTGRRKSYDPNSRLVRNTY